MYFSLQAAVIRWLLDHNPANRPTSKELLQSPLLPPPEMAEAELNEIVKSAIANPNSSSYRRMVSALFCQPVSSVTDLTYDMDLHKVIACFYILSYKIACNIYNSFPYVQFILFKKRCFSTCMKQGTK